MSIELPKVAFGTWSWGVGGMAGGDRVFGNHLEAPELRPVFEAGAASAPSLWDTATVYGMGASESILGSFVREVPREDIVISTKFTPQIAPKVERPVEAMLEASLRRFGTDYVDLYWIHNPSDVRRWTPELVPLLESGKVKAVGVSNHDLAEIRLAQDILVAKGFRLSAVQNHFSLLYRSSEDAGILEYCAENDLAFFAYMVLEQGALAGRYDTENPLPAGSGRAATYNALLPKLELLNAATKEIGASRGATAAQVAIAWAMAKGTIPLVGVTKTSHVEDASQARSIRLTEAEMAELETLAREARVDTKGGWEKRMVE